MKKEKLFHTNKRFNLQKSMNHSEKGVVDALKPKIAVGGHLLNKLRANKILLERRNKLRKPVEGNED